MDNVYKVIFCACYGQVHSHNCQTNLSTNLYAVSMVVPTSESVCLSQNPFCERNVEDIVFVIIFFFATLYFKQQKIS